MKRILILLFVLLLTLTACGGDDTESETAVAPQLTKIRLPMGYIPDPQYAPYYVAVDKGYYADEGIEIEFDYSFETDGMALVGDNRLPFAIVSGDQVILARAQGLPVVYVLEWFQRYPIVVVSKQSAGIETPADLAGRNVGLPGFFGASYVGINGLLSANNMQLSDLNVNDIGFTQIESLMTDQSEAVVGYANNEPVQVAAMGEAINTIYVADYIDMVANGIITNEQTIQNDPQLIERLIRATLRGLQDTLNNPDEAYEISKKFVEGLDDSRKNVLEASLPIWEAPMLGITDAIAWENTQNVLVGMGFLDAPLADLEKAYTNEFVLAVQP